MRKSDSSILIYNFLKVVVVLYLFPGSYILLDYICNRNTYTFGDGLVLGPAIMSNNYINRFIYPFMYVWIIGMCGILCIHLISFIKLIIYIRNCTEVPAYKIDRLNIICKELKIKRKVRLRESTHIFSPFIFGCIRPTIYLPAGDECDSILDNIYYHELNHYKQNDMLIRALFLVISTIYWFNPIVWYTHSQMKIWAEFSCDERCCGKKFKVQEYFQPMIQILERYNSIANTIVPMWAESKKGLKGRVIHMCEKKKSVSKFRKILVSTVASVCFVAIGTCTSLGVTMAGGRVYNDVYVDTVEWIPEPYQAKEYEENTQSAVVFEEGCEVLYDEGTTDGYQDNGEIRGIQSYDWTLSNNSIRCGKMLNLRAGQRIAITAVIDPADKYVCVGIVQPDGTYRYVYDKECVAHTFTLTQTGTHRVMAKNTSGSTVNILLAYSIS